MIRKYLASGAAAIAAAAFLVLNPISASAADIVEEPPPVAENNWYVSLHGGWKFGEDWEDDIDLDLCLFWCLLSIDEVDVTAETDDGWRVGGSIGYMFNSWFALEGEIGWMNQDFDSLDIESIDGSIFGHEFSYDCTDPWCKGIGLDGDVSILTGMVNAIVGLPVGGVIRPYVGVGAGVAHVKFDSVGLSDFPSICCLDDSDTTFAWQGFVGADFGITENLALGIRGRALKIENIEVEDDGDFEHDIDPDWIKSIEAVLTFAFP
jgi:opacity protein-like surface antigen